MILKNNITLLNPLYLNQLQAIDAKYFNNDAYNLTTLKDMINNPNYKIYVIIINQIIASYLITLYSDVIEILRICTVQEFQRQGLAKALIDNIKLQNKDIFLEVNSNNTNAIKFYINNDFKQISIRKKYYDNNADAIIMQWKFLLNQL